VNWPFKARSDGTLETGAESFQFIWNSSCIRLHFKYVQNQL